MARAASLPPKSVSHWPFVLALVALVVAVFQPVLGFEFVRWDDDINITQNPLLTAPWSWSLAGQFFSADQALRFKPLHWLFFRGLHELFGFDPRAWHAFNLTLHAIAAVLFYLVLVRVFELLAPGENKIRPWAASLGAAIWAVHPLRAEPVAWATASPYPLTAVCLLASFALYLKASRQTARRGWLVCSWVFAVAAYASYPVSIAYGLFLMATDAWLLRHREASTIYEETMPPAGPLWTPGWNLAWMIKLSAFLVPAMLAVGVTLRSRFNSPGIFGEAPAVEAVGMMTRAHMALASLPYLVFRFFVPINLTPNLPPLTKVEMAGWGIVALAALALVVLAVTWSRRREFPGTALVWIGFAAVALPCLGWTERPTWPVDRYSYVAHLVLTGGFAGALLHWARGSRAKVYFLGLIGAVALGICGLFARRQAMIWRDSPTLFTHMEQDPHFADSPRQQGHVYILWAYYEAANAHAAQAEVLFNKAQRVYLDAIRAAADREDYREALALMTHLERYFPVAPVIRREKGSWLLHTGRPREALVELRAAQAALPDDARVRSLLESAQQQAAGTAP